MNLAKSFKTSDHDDNVVSAQARKIKSMRWRLVGGPTEVTCNPKRLWEMNAQVHGILTAVTFKLENCVFPTEPEGRHMTNWFGGEHLTLKHFWIMPDKTRGAQLTNDEVKDAGLENKTLMLKIVVEPHMKKNKRNMSVKLRTLAIPGNMDEAKAVANKWNVNVQDPTSMLTMALITGTERHFLIPMGIDEDQNDAAGLGILPLVEVRTNVENFHYPSRDEIAKEMQAFFRDWQLANVIKPTTKEPLETLLKAADKQVGELIAKPNGEWPQLWTPPPPLVASEDEQGKRRFSIFFQFLRVLGGKVLRRKDRYGEGGFFKASDFVSKGLNPRAATQISSLINSSRASNSWRQDDAVMSVVNKVSADWQVDMRPPWSSNVALTFVAACAEKKLRADTVRQYLSSIRTRHRQLAVSTEGLEGYLLNAAILGLEKSQPEKTRSRGAVTPEMLKILKSRAYLYANNIQDEAILWLVCSLLWHCAMRGSELLGSKADEIVNDKTMLWSALTLTEKEVEGELWEVLRVEIKGQKQSRGKQTQVMELYPTPSELCPVAALKRAIEVGCLMEGPVARWTSGIMITAQFMNKFLRESLEPITDWKRSPITTHSFRAGLPTLLSRIGEQDSTIKDVGRWKSTAYKLYQKEGSKDIGERIKLFRRIGAAM